MSRFVEGEDRRQDSFMRANRVETFDMRCNAHREMHTTVAQHLLDREHRVELVQFEDDEARAICISSDMVWELSVRHADGSQSHVASFSFEKCVALLQKADGMRLPSNVAA